MKPPMDCWLVFDSDGVPLDQLFFSEHDAVDAAFEWDERESSLVTHGVYKVANLREVNLEAE